MQQTPSETFRTSDLYFTAFLLCQGEPLLEVQERAMPGKRRVVFTFPRSVQELLPAYQNGAQCSAREFASNVDHCKSMIFDMDGTR